MNDLKERDAMVCRSCANEERASEGYPCTNCGTFICIICSFKGIVLCTECAALEPDLKTAVATQSRAPIIDWPEH